VRQPGDAPDLDAFVLEGLGLGVARFAIDTARVGLAVVDLAGLFGEALSDVIAVGLDLAPQFGQGAAQLGGLGALPGRSTFLEPQTGQRTSPAAACSS
jgi:hypothetical protein